jgi:hypothetical protein
MRKRLSWDEGAMKTADPYDMNQTRTNPPAEKYQTGGPSQFAEDQDMATTQKIKQEGRTETGHPSPKEAHEAVVNARKMEDKAIKCITIAQRMLPGAEGETIEAQATDLMFLPEKCVMATLQRQTDLAEKIAGVKEEDEKEEKEAAKKPEEKEEKEAAKKPEEKKEEKEAAKKPEEKEEKEAAKKPEEKKEEVEAAKKQDTPEEKKKEEVEAAKKQDTPEEKKKEEVESAKKPEEKKPEEPEIEISSGDLLDQIFAAELNPEEKAGAKKLSGLVKKASVDSVGGLESLWETPTDISQVFPSRK